MQSATMRARRTLAMKIEGAHDIPAPRQRVWEAFLDPEQLRKPIPGCERLAAIAGDGYKATMRAGVGAVTGPSGGTVPISHQAAAVPHPVAVAGTAGPGLARARA